MDEVRRADDHELCGFVAERAGAWSALTVFGGVLGEHGRRADAEAQVHAEGLASLSRHWTLVDGTTGSEEIALIQEANRNRVVVALGYYSMPGVPTLAIDTSDLESGRWSLRLHS